MSEELKAMAKGKIYIYIYTFFLFFFCFFVGVYGDEEFIRAKNQLKSMILMNLENSFILFDEIARQTQLFNKRNTAQEHLEKIDSLTKEDIQKVAQTIVSGKPSLVSRGGNVITNDQVAMNVLKECF